MSEEQWGHYNDALNADRAKKYGASVEYSLEGKAAWYAALNTLTPELEGISWDDIQRFALIGRVLSAEFQGE